METDISTKIAVSGKKIKRHVAVWFILLCYFVLSALEAGWPFWFSVATQTPYCALYVTTFYILLYKVCPWWHQDKLHFLVLSTVGVILFVVVYVFLDLTIPEYVLLGEAQPSYPLRIHILDAISMLMFVEITVLGAYFQRYSIGRIEANSKKAIELAQVEERLVRQELDFYKSEFNTHITFNTLSHIYAKVMDDPEVASPVLVLSDILRYNLTVQANQEVAIERELDYLKSFIEIHRVLFPKLQIRFRVEGDLENVRILPRILISFVENAIKHGDKSNASNPIQITLSADEQICFSVVNKKRKNTLRTNRVPSTKTGIKNVQRTLEAFYQDNYQLDIKEDSDSYQVHLTIDSIAHHSNSRRSLVA